MDNLFKALGDQNRLRIINLLRKGELCVCEIEVILETTQSNVSRHISKLKNVGIIAFTKDAQWIHYYINPYFIEENQLLYQYVIEKMEQNSLLLKDIERLKKYKGSGFTCEDLKENCETIFS